LVEKSRSLSHILDVSVVEEFSPFLICIAIEPLGVSEMAHFAYKAHEFLPLDCLDSRPSSGMTEFGVDPTSVKQKTLSVL